MHFVTSFLGVGVTSRDFFFFFGPSVLDYFPPFGTTNSSPVSTSSCVSSRCPGLCVFVLIHTCDLCWDDLRQTQRKPGDRLPHRTEKQNIVLSRKAFCFDIVLPLFLLHSIMKTCCPELNLTIKWHVITEEDLCYQWQMIVEMLTLMSVLRILRPILNAVSVLTTRIGSPTRTPAFTLRTAHSCEQGKSFYRKIIWLSLSLSSSFRWNPTRIM